MSKGKEKTIFDLTLHEKLDCGELVCYRVTTGWIYVTANGGTVFVPYHRYPPRVCPE